MSFFSELEDLTREAISTFGKDEDGSQLQLTWKGKTIDCFEEDSETVDALKAGGIVQETDMVLRALRSDFGTSGPRSMEEVSFKGNTWKIKGVMGSQGDPECRLVLIGVRQRK